MHPARPNPRLLRRAAVMLLAIITLTVAFVVGLTFISESSATVGAAGIVARHAQARQIAESGIGIVARYIEETRDWRQNKTTGTWVNELPLLGGTLSVEAAFQPESGPDAAVIDPSFETQTASLPTPLLAPPMSGSVGGWQVRRTATVQTGPTVPTIGTQASPNATSGANAAFISFGASVSGSGTFSQVVAGALAPRTLYEFDVDITISTGLPNLTYGFRVLAGSQTVASTEHAWTLELPQDPDSVPAPPSDPSDPGEYEAMLTHLGVAPGSPTTWKFTFATDASPPAGNVTLELFAQSSGLLASVWFDNVRVLQRRNDPVTFTATGRVGNANHVVSASVASAFDGKSHIVSWNEP